MNKNSKIKSAIRIILFIAIAGFMIIFYLKIKNIEQNLGQESSGLINITPFEKTTQQESVQSIITNLIDEQAKSTASVMMKKKIKVLGEDDEVDSEIETTKSQEGNAIILTTDGYLLTNKHVVEDKQGIYSAIINGKEYNIDKIRNDDELDISIIKVKPDESLITAKLPNMDYETKIGDIVLAIKNDIDSKETWAKIGIINSKNQKLKQKNGNTYIGLIKTSTAIEAGFSGGPLVDINGNTIGINTAIDNIEYGATYSLPLSQEFVTETLRSIKENNKIVRPDLGIEYEYYNNGIKVTNIIAGSNAEKAGLIKNDIIVGINNYPVNYNNFLYTLYTHKVGKSVVLNIVHGDLKNNVQIVLTSK